MATLSIKFCKSLLICHCLGLSGLRGKKARSQILLYLPMMFMNKAKDYFARNYVIAKISRFWWVGYTTLPRNRSTCTAKHLLFIGIRNLSGQVIVLANQCVTFHICVPQTVIVRWSWARNISWLQYSLTRWEWWSQFRQCLRFYCSM